MKSNSLVRDIHIGRVIELLIKEKNLSIEIISKAFNCSGNSINQMLCSKSLETNVLLKWCKILRYDLFRLYSSHLMLHHGISNTVAKKKNNTSVAGINIRKNVYTKELIVFLISKVRNKEMKSMEVIKKYGVPKTTFYKWLQKFSDD